MPAPDAVRKLVETFENNREAYKRGAYNETQVRREFIDPFFEALGSIISIMGSSWELCLMGLMGSSLLLTHYHNHIDWRQIFRDIGCYQK